MIKKGIVFLLQLILIAFLAFIARECWLAYEQEKLTALFTKEASPVSVRVASVSAAKKNWKDYISNNKYIEFLYHGKDYQLRILQDSGWIGEGSQVWLLYHPGLDQFRQPGLLNFRQSNRHESKLVEWTILRIASPAHRMLFAAVVLSFIVLLIVCSLVSKLTDLTVFNHLSYALIVVAFAGGGLFMSWDTWANYQYYQQLKSGTALTLPLLEKDRVTEHQTNRSSNIPFHYYTATVAYPKEPRTIMISSDEYDRFVVGNRLPVVYNASLDDMMGAGYTLGYRRLIFLALLWVVIGYILLKKNKRGS